MLDLFSRPRELAQMKSTPMRQPFSHSKNMQDMKTGEKVGPDRHDPPLDAKV